MDNILQLLPLDKRFHGFLNICNIMWCSSKFLVAEKMLNSENVEDDILQVLPLDKWPILRDTLKVNWPKFAPYYYYIDNSIRWREKDPSWEVDYLCPNGDPKAGVFLVIAPVPLYNIIPFAFEQQQSLLFKCLTETKLIDWSQTVMLRSVHITCQKTVEEAVDYFAKIRKFHISDRESMRHYIKFRDECGKVEIKIPDGFELRILNDETHLSEIFDGWNYEDLRSNPKSCKKFLSNVLRFNKGIGLFNKKENKMISWALKNEWCGLGMLHTLDEYKGRGYARIVVNALSKMLGKEGLDVNIMIADDNVISEYLGTSLNWQMTGSEINMKLQPLWKQSVL